MERRQKYRLVFYCVVKYFPFCGFSHFGAFIIQTHIKSYHFPKFDYVFIKSDDFVITENGSSTVALMSMLHAFIAVAMFAIQSAILYIREFFDFVIRFFFGQLHCLFISKSSTSAFLLELSFAKLHFKCICN